MKIKVNYLGGSAKLEFARLDNGTIISYGRSLPF